MSIDYDLFLKWATSRFGAENIRLHGDEIKTHSPWIDDHKFHLWMNPSGGKRRLDAGGFRCWKTDRMGSLVTLVSEIDRISPEEAEYFLESQLDFRALERKLHAVFGSKRDVDAHYEDDTDVKSDDVLCEFPPATYPINRTVGYYRRAAEDYLSQRCLPVDNFHVCTGGEYKNRIIIPYYDIYGTLVFYNARIMSHNTKALRYLKPSIPGVTQDEIFFMVHWPVPGEKIYITEGEFDAASLSVANLNGAACGGKHLSESQIETLRQYQYTPVIATDTDKSGKEALIAMCDRLRASGFTNVYCVRPPVGYKDWNDLLVKKGKGVLRAYIESCEKRFTDTLKLRMGF